MLDHRMHPLNLFILNSNLIPEEFNLLAGLLTDGSQLRFIFGGQIVKGVLQVLTLSYNRRIVYIDFFLGLSNQNTRGLAPGAVYQRPSDSLHGGDPQVLYITGHDSVDGYLGDT